MTDKRFWWLSFADPSKPHGQRFLGAMIVEAEDMIDAVLAAHKLKINPGGEVQGAKIPKHLEHRIKPGDLNRLLSREEAESYDKEYQEGR